MALSESAIAAAIRTEVVEAAGVFALQQRKIETLRHDGIVAFSRQQAEMRQCRRD
jgi:hypothetical protein